MKRKVSKILVLFLTLALMVPIAIATENEANKVNTTNSATIQEVLDIALKADGIEAEANFDTVLNVFQEDVLSFLKVLKGYTEEEQDKILWMIAESAAISQSEEFLSIMSSFDKEDIIYKKLTENYKDVMSLVESISNGNSIEAPRYDIDTVLSLASAYLENGEMENMELFSLLTEAYYAEPIAMANAINQNFSNVERQQLVTGMVKVCAETGTVNLHTIAEIESELQGEIIHAIKSEANADDLRSQNATAYTPTITSFSYSGTIEVGKPTTLTIKLTEQAGTSTARSYTVKTYCTRDGQEYQVSSVNMTIPKNSTTASKKVTLTFSHAGEFTTRVAVYSGNTLLTTREGRSPDVSHGRWKIVCTFPKDRTKYGVFALYNAAGELQETGDCLGLSTKNIDENIPWGNTPCGTYTGYLTGPITGGDNPAKYGPYKCVDADAVDVPCINDGTRNDGMWIHGGRSQKKLQPTDGCVRVFDADMLDIQRSIETMTKTENGHYKTGDVIYQEK